MTITIEDKKLRKYLDKNIDKLKDNISRATKKTLAKGLRVAVEETPKRTGQGRRGWSKKQKSKLSGVIKNDVGHIKALNDGRSATTITPVRAKWLMFATESRALTDTKAQVRKSSKRKFWNIASKEGFENATRKTGVAVAKKVRQPARRGTKFIEKNIVPKVANIYKKEILKEIF